MGSAKNTDVWCYRDVHRTIDSSNPLRCIPRQLQSAPFRRMDCLRIRVGLYRHICFLYCLCQLVHAFGNVPTCNQRQGCRSSDCIQLSFEFHCGIDYSAYA